MIVILMATVFEIINRTEYIYLKTYVVSIVENVKHASQINYK